MDFEKSGEIGEEDGGEAAAVVSGDWKDGVMPFTSKVSVKEEKSSNLRRSISEPMHTRSLDRVELVPKHVLSSNKILGRPCISDL